MIHTLLQEVQTKTKELNLLFEKCASYHIKFNCSFDQSQSFGDKGNEAHLIVKAYKEVS